ncbi:ankyrin repeat domain-containing protein [Pseudorhodobacter aquimaris]|uniref:ankyrin repeat domain-containing protein n=1 Tax=Pseudorhodobacter aquimaris TaxID=687412 RepID=UPI00067B79D5|nr:ankyrin repeat domain-containing protein [Pseudorhodobacter aquimaris]
MNTLKLALLIIFAAAEGAAADCSKLNAREFLENALREDVIECVEKSPEVIRKTDGRGYNLLMTAVSSDIDPLVLDYLIESLPDGVNDIALSERDSRGWTLGHIAAAEALNPINIFVLSKNVGGLTDTIEPEVNPQDAGKTPMHLAAAREDGWPFVAALLATGYWQDVDEKDRTPLDIALGKPETVINAILLSEGTWPDIYLEHYEHEKPAENANCDNFLTAAFFAKADEALVVACLTDANQLIAVDEDGNSVLHLASAHAQDAWIIDHIIATADSPMTLLEKRNSTGKTALHLAAETSVSPGVPLHLLAWGADPNALFKEEKRRLRKNRGITALQMAADRKDEVRETFILSLLAFGADTMAQDVSIGVVNNATTGGRTALHRALIAPEPKTLLMLLEAQASQENLVGYVMRALRGRFVKQIGDDMGRTALHMAASRTSDFDTLTFLIEYGFSADEQDDEGNTPLMFAAGNFADADAFLYLLEDSKKPCGQSKSGVTVEAALRSNKTLMTESVNDKSGKILSPLAILKQRCP